MKKKVYSTKYMKYLIVILLLINVIAISVAVWIVFSGNKNKVIEPDFTKLDVEENAETIEDDFETKAESTKGSGSVTINYSNQVHIGLNDNRAELMFANPNRSSHDIVVQIYIKEMLIVQSGLIKSGNQIHQLELLPGVSNYLKEGIYGGKFKLLFYDSQSGEKSMIDTEIPVTISVKE